MVSSSALPSHNLLFLSGWKEREVEGGGGGECGGVGGFEKARLCFQAGKFEVLCLEARFRVQHTV